MSQKFVYVNSDGLYTEATAYETSDFINVSAGAGDAGKPIVLDANGHIDASMLNDADIDHGSLGGLGDDDHSQYILVDGSRAFTGNQSMGSNKITSLANGTDSNDAVNLSQLQAVENQIANLEFQDSVIDRYDPTSGLPAAPSTGDRYLATATANGWTTNYIYEYNGATWDEIVPTTGMFVSVDDENDRLFYYTGAAWTEKYFEATTASLGCEKVGMDIRLDLLANGGLALTGNEVGLDWSASFDDSKPVKASDLASVANGYGASIIGIEDAGGYTSETDVEGALQELYGLVDDFGQNYTVGAGGITKGDLAYISAANTVLPYATLTQSHRGIGLALTTESAAATVKVLANDTILQGVLSGATAGTPYYWDGSAMSSSIPAGAGSHVWQVGVAKNATDLAVEVRFIKKNA